MLQIFFMSTCYAVFQLVSLTDVFLSALFHITYFAGLIALKNRFSVSPAIPVLSLLLVNSYVISYKFDNPVETVISPPILLV